MTFQAKNRIEYKEYGGLWKQLKARYFSRLPFMKRWLSFTKQNKGMIPYALALFDVLRSSSRPQPSRLVAQVEGTGFAASQIVMAIKAHKLVVVKPGRTAGIFCPPK